MDNWLEFFLWDFAVFSLVHTLTDGLTLYIVHNKVKVIILTIYLV